MPIVRVIGPGRAGSSLSAALGRVGWTVLPPLGRGDDLADAGRGVDGLVVATPDDAVAAVAAAVRPRAEVVVLHLSGSLGPDVLLPHPRRAALHPLVPLPDAGTGAERLLSGATFVVAGDPFAMTVAAALGGRPIELPDDARPAYHAAAAIAANHVVALLAQVERVAASVGLPLDAFLPLARAAVEDVGRLGPRRALTGPAARGDWRTLARHLDALAPEERAGYRAGVGLALAATVGPEVRGATGPAGDGGGDRRPADAVAGAGDGAGAGGGDRRPADAGDGAGAGGGDRRPADAGDGAGTGAGGDRRPADAVAGAGAGQPKVAVRSVVR